MAARRKLCRQMSPTKKLPREIVEDHSKENSSEFICSDKNLKNIYLCEGSKQHGNAFDSEGDNIYNSDVVSAVIENPSASTSYLKDGNKNIHLKSDWKLNPCEIKADKLENDVMNGSPNLTKDKPLRRKQRNKLRDSATVIEEGEVLTTSVRERKKKKSKKYMSLIEEKVKDTSHMDHYTLLCDVYRCKALFKTQSSLNLHKSCHRKEGKGFECVYCKQIFTQWKPMRGHLWQVHEVDTDLLACELCSFKTDALYRLKTHKEIHSDERAYKCPLCERTFKQQGQVIHHRKAIHSEKPKVVSVEVRYCDICKKGFNTKLCLSQHVKAVHHKAQIFQCTYCSYRATRRAMWRLHLRTHTGEKPFKCNECEYETSDHNSLRRHKMRHSGQKQYMCQYCAYSCIQSISLKSHMKSKHPGLAGVHSCEICQFRTIDKTIYDQHVLEHELGLLTYIPKDQSEKTQNLKKISNLTNREMLSN